MREKVSVIVPVFQVKDYLEKCILSILTQTYRNLEIILVDDGSTDGSEIICDQFALRDERIRVLHKENQGLSSARNTGLDYATGEYIAFVDSDDWIDERYIHQMYEVCKKYECDICQCGFFDAVCDDIFYKDHGGYPSIYSPIEFAYAEFSLLSWDCIVCWNKLYRASLFKNIRFPVGRIHEDEYVTYMLTYNANKIAVLPTRLYYYRRRNDSIVGRKYSYKRLDAREAIIERENFYHSIGEKELENVAKARYLHWMKGQIKQFSQIADRDEKLENEIIEECKELDCQLDSIDVIRRKFSRDNYVFPFDLIGVKKNIVLYGGGNVGQQYYLQIKATNYCNIIAWIDKDYDNLRQIGIPVQSTDDIEKTKDNADYYVIALAKADIAKNVIEMLAEKYMIDKKKIVYCINSVMGIEPFKNV